MSGFCRFGEDRTLDPMIKSHVLYQLSYEPFWLADAKLTNNDPKQKKSPHFYGNFALFKILA